MNVASRVLRCRLLEKLTAQPELCKRLGLSGRLLRAEERLPVDAPEEEGENIPSAWPDRKNIGGFQIK